MTKLGGDKEGFLKAFNTATKQQGSAHTRVFNECVLISLEGNFPVNHREIYISNLKANEHQKGWGTQAMTWLTRLADEYDVDLVLDAYPTGDDSPSPAKLKEFYRRFGFVKGSRDIMFREAAPVLPQV